jgi:ABC-type branched-subunit amino acid transport system substrate-binding protein
VVFDEEVTPGDVDLLSTMTRLLATKPDVVVNLTLPPQVSTVARLLRDRRFAGRHVGAPPMYNFSEIKAAAGALAGAHVSGPRLDRKVAFPNDYLARFGEPILPEAVFGYDAARMVLESSKSPDGIASIVRANTFTGLAGVYTKSVANQYEVPGELKVITTGGQIEAAGESFSER